MAASGASTASRTKLALALSLLLALPAISGCYLSHLAAGQLRLLRASQPIEETLADSTTPPELREQLELVLETRRFARSLGLEAGDQYTDYAPWEGDRVVTTVVAAEAGSVEPAGFWFPIVGTVPYKGFFDPARAEREAERLRGEGMDVCVVPVSAYSTLGWFADPVTGPMLRHGPGRLVETLVHELVHATVYLPDQADFNEGVATFIGEEGSVHFFDARGDDEAARRRRLEISDDHQIDAVRLHLRNEVEALYTESAAGPERDAQRAAIETRARARVAALPLQTRDAASLSERLLLGDACLGLAATYTADLPAYQERLETLGGDLPAFVQELRAAADADEPRSALLGP